jgi:hypothetical protein
MRAYIYNIYKLYAYMQLTQIYNIYKLYEYMQLAQIYNIHKLHVYIIITHRLRSQDYLQIVCRYIYKWFVYENL